MPLTCHSPIIKQQTIKCHPDNGYIQALFPTFPTTKSPRSCASRRPNHHDLWRAYLHSSGTQVEKIFSSARVVPQRLDITRSNLFLWFNKNSRCMRPSLNLLISYLDFGDWRSLGAPPLYGVFHLCGSACAAHATAITPLECGKQHG